MKLIELLPADDCILTEEKLYEMARIKPANSGLPQIIFASTRDYGTGAHWARIKVSNIPGTFAKEDNFAVSISHEPTIVGGKSKYKPSQLNDIFDWVKLNYEPLMKFWNDEYEDDADFYQELIKI